MNHIRLSLASLIVVAASLVGCKSTKNGDQNTDNTDTIAVTKASFNVDSAFQHVEKQCAFGARTPNSKAHTACGDYIVSEFKRLGLDVTEQKADLRGWDGTMLHARNIIASYKPEAERRIIICTHWESRPWADQDPDTANHHKPVMAANDGASGVAVMFEVARHLAEINPAAGIDFICFDAEDYGAPYWADQSQVPDDGSDWCLGSRYWASHLHKEGYKAEGGILLDMVGGQDARFAFEGFSLRYARDILVKVWDAATRADAANLFQPVEGGYATDDHGPMNEIAGIPTIDVIPFVEGEHSFGSTWHTTADTPENISRQTLRGVGQTLLQFLSEL